MSLAEFGSAFRGDLIGRKRTARNLVEREKEASGRICTRGSSLSSCSIDSGGQGFGSGLQSRFEWRPECMDDPEISLNAIFSRIHARARAGKRGGPRGGAMDPLSASFCSFQAFMTRRSSATLSKPYGPIGAGCANELVDREGALFCIGHSLSIRRGKRRGIRVPQRLSVFRHSLERQKKKGGRKTRPPFFRIAWLPRWGAAVLRPTRRALCNALLRLVHAAHAAWAARAACCCGALLVVFLDFGD